MSLDDARRYLEVAGDRGADHPDMARNFALMSIAESLIVLAEAFTEDPEDE